MGQSSCFAKLRMENASKLQFQISWVNRVVSPNYAWKMLQNFNFKFHGSIELFRQNTHGKCIKTLISKFMGQSISFAEFAWKLHQNFNFKIHGSIDFFRQITHGKCFKTEISKFMCQSICFEEACTKNA